MNLEGNNFKAAQTTRAWPTSRHAAISLVATLIASCTISSSNDGLRRISSLPQLPAEMAAASPGESIVLSAGTYVLDSHLELSANGLPGRPVTVVADGAGVRIVGSGSLNVVKSNWLIIRGFTLETEAKTFSVSDSTHVRISDFRFRFQKNSAVSEQPDLRTHWLRFRDGTGHRIDHSEFGPHDGSLGVVLLVDDKVRDIRIDHNHFHDRPRHGKNGAEIIRLGSATNQRIDADVSQNLFERCNGEAEVVSIKSNGARIRDNIFRNNAGRLVVRNGDDVLIEGNRFENTSTVYARGGIRLHGRNICVVANSFAGIPPPVLQTFAGMPDIVSRAGENQITGRRPIHSYRQSTKIVFAGNVIIEESRSDESEATVTSQIDLGRFPNSDNANFMPPSNWLVASNLVRSATPLITGDKPDDFTVLGNEIHEPAKSESIGHYVATALHPRKPTRSQADSWAKFASACITGEE